MTEETEKTPASELGTTSPSPVVGGAASQTHRGTKWVLPVTLLLVGFVAGVIVQAPRVTAGFNAGVERDSLKKQLVTVTIERDAMATQLDPIHRAQEASASAAAAAADAAVKAKAEADAKAAAAVAAAAAAAKANTFAAGIYLVGTDLPAGRYKGAPAAGSAYWQISSDANGNDIIANNNVEGPFYIEVKAGQYLEVRRAQITRVQ